MNVSRLVYKILSVAWAVLIFALVPLGRPLMVGLEAPLEVLSEIPLLFWLNSLFAVAALWAIEVKASREHLSRLVSATVFAAFVLFLAQPQIEVSHLLLYGGLMFFLRKGFFPTNRLTSLGAAVLTLALVSLVDEIFQGLNPTRFFDLKDLVLNLFSGLSGLALTVPYGLFLLQNRDLQPPPGAKYSSLSQ